MHDKHQPDRGFVDRLEWQVSSEVRRRNRATEGPIGFLRTPVRVALSAALLMAVSMSFGAAAVAASYQAEDNWRRELLQTSLEMRIELANRRLELAIEELGSIQRQNAVGTMTREQVLEGRLRVADAEAQLGMLSLELEEVEATGREPLGEISSPLVDGRDFVSERLELQMHALDQQYELAQLRRQQIDTRVDLGISSPLDAEPARLQLLSVETAMFALREKLDLREQFLAGDLPAAEAELSVLEVDAQQRLRALTPQLDLANRELADLEGRRRVGNVTTAVVRQAMVRVLTVETELETAQIELEMIRRQLEERRQQR